ncbi:amidohydrolase family protein [Nocardia camponoti]|uniref:Amidohydrolase n=1 Tax=Nocardia camponoti TaxID=1616106 RepID=A0A917V487_9NOCA|nr:amidohydrolase family protein [Nocardia camponoti]GGK34714.1 putative amidohydrolase [Nocardia camponoti]
MTDTAAYLADVRDRLDLPGIVDIHTHFMPDQVMRKVWAYFDSAGPLTGRPWPITYRDDEQVRLKTLRDFGVRAFTSLVYPHKPGMAEWLNSWTADFAARTPGCLHTATLFPEPDAPRYVTEAIDAGARIFKVHIQVGAYSPEDPLLDPVWQILADRDVPALIHCGSGPAPGEFTGPAPVARVLERFPNLRLIIAHMGTPEYSAFLDIADRFPRTYFDTTMVFTRFSEADAPFPTTERDRLVRMGDRILFGSDFPNIPYDYGEAVNALERLDLGDDWVRKVLSTNAVELFDLS